MITELHDQLACAMADWRLVEQLQRALDQHPYAAHAAGTDRLGEAETAVRLQTRQLLALAADHIWRLVEYQFGLNPPIASSAADDQALGQAVQAWLRARATFRHHEHEDCHRDGNVNPRDYFMSQPTRQAADRLVAAQDKVWALLLAYFPERP